MKLWFPYYVNDVDSLIPEWWANESLMILEENMVAAQLVHRDFENQLQKYGDVVNTRKPADFTAQRKGTNDDVTIQDATAPNVQVKLDQQVHVSFLIRDGDEGRRSAPRSQGWSRWVWNRAVEGLNRAS